MQEAIALAKKGTGRVSPNPLVGAVIVKDGKVIGRGYHEKYGQPHAERNALSSCSVSPEGADMYVTLEPCCHHVKQPPCTEAIVAAGIKRVIIGSSDPNPLVSGKGVVFLKEHGIEVEEGFMKEKISFSSLEELINTWEDINTITTERCYNSTYVSKSDTIYDSSYVYNSTNCSNCKNSVFCDGCGRSEYLLASQRSGNCTFSIRVDDSNNCSNSYSVICSNKISNSLFIQDCFNLDECMFCSHIANKKYCICNMQYDEYEYFVLKKLIIEWIVNS